MKKNNWTREQTIVAFNVYCKIPFKNSSKTHPDIIKYAKIIGRSPSALNMKIGNFGRLDPQLRKQGISGLSHGSKLEKEIWDEFQNDWEDLVYQSEILIAEFQNKSIEDIICDEGSDFPAGMEHEKFIKSRVNQNFFRSMILSSYNQKCCMTGLSLPELLVASHIIPWHKNKKERINPRNGLCLNSLHDKAFDRGLITVSADYKIIVSKHLMNIQDDDFTKNCLVKFHKNPIFMPTKFPPDGAFLEYHNKHVFRQ